MIERPYKDNTKHTRKAVTSRSHHSGHTVAHTQHTPSGPQAAPNPAMITDITTVHTRTQPGQQQTGRITIPDLASVRHITLKARECTHTHTQAHTHTHTYKHFKTKTKLKNKNTNTYTHITHLKTATRRIHHVIRTGSALDRSSTRRRMSRSSSD